MSRWTRDEEDEIDREIDRVEVISRKQFLKEFAREYRPGQHVTAMGPSGRGKTELMGQMAGAVVRAHPQIKLKVLHGKIKGRDQTIERFAKSARLSIGPEANPTWMQRHVTKRKSHGHIVRPLEKPMESPAAENEHIASKFRRAIHSSYHTSAKRPVILFVDEAHQAHNDLRLRTDCEGPLMRGRPVCGVWSLLQRGRYVSYMVYDQAEDILIFFDPDRDNQRRYSEIGGVDADVLIRLSRQLKTKTVADGSTISQALWFKRSGSRLAIVDT